MPKISEYNKG